MKEWFFGCKPIPKIEYPILLASERSRLIAT